MEMAIRKNVYDDYFEEEVWEKNGLLGWKATKMLMQEPEHMKMFRRVFTSGELPVELRIKIFKWLFQIVRFENSAPNDRFCSLFNDPHVAFCSSIPLPRCQSKSKYYPFCRGFCFKCGEKAFKKVNGIQSNHRRILLLMLYCYQCTVDGFRCVEDTDPIQYPNKIKCRIKFYPNDDLTALLASTCVVTK